MTLSINQPVAHRPWRAAMRLTVCWFAMAVGLWLGTATAHGADTPDVEQELRQLKDENKLLRDRLDRQEGLIEELLEKVQAQEARSAATVMPPAAPLPPELLAASLGDSMPQLELRAFADVNYQAGGKVRDGDTQPNSFSLGQVDLFATSQLSDKFSVLSELVFHFNANESGKVSIERLQLQYAAGDWLNLGLGRIHTPFGYWNETFHHGTWFQTTAQRPEMLRFHDGGSVLPTHSVGLYASGRLSFPEVTVSYDVGVANGRGATYTQTQNLQDANDSKAVFGVLSFEPDCLPGLTVGGNFYLDWIPADPTVPARAGEIDETILGWHMIYLRNNIELLSELDYIRHEDSVSGMTFETWGCYLQLAYTMGDWKPYYRFDWLDVGAGDPYYGPLIMDLTRNTFGVRWDLSTWVALKLEYHYLSRADTGTPHEVLGQASFAF